MASSNQLTQAERIAETFGMVLGAASYCDEVTDERLNSVAAKVKEVVLATANDEADAESAQERFSIAVEAGRTAVETGKIDPDAAEGALGEMEQELST
jgi:hypothetical protein